MLFWDFFLVAQVRYDSWGGLNERPPFLTPDRSPGVAYKNIALQGSGYTSKYVKQENIYFVIFISAFPLFP